MRWNWRRPAVRTWRRHHSPAAEHHLGTGQHHRVAVHAAHAARL